MLHRLQLCGGGKETSVEVDRPGEDVLPATRQGNVKHSLALHGHLRPGRCAQAVDVESGAGHATGNLTNPGCGCPLASVKSPPMWRCWRPMAGR